MLRTREPLTIASPFDLHVLGPPQTFALSQDQTLQFESAHSISRVFDLAPAKGRVSGCESLRTRGPTSAFSYEASCAPYISASSSSIQFSGGVRPRRRCSSTPVGEGRVLFRRLRLVKLFFEAFFETDFHSGAPSWISGMPRTLELCCPISTSRFRPARLAGGGVYSQGVRLVKSLSRFFREARSASSGVFDPPTQRKREVQSYSRCFAPSSVSWAARRDVVRKSPATGTRVGRDLPLADGASGVHLATRLRRSPR